MKSFVPHAIAGLLSLPLLLVGACTSDDGNDDQTGGAGSGGTASSGGSTGGTSGTGATGGGSGGSGGGTAGSGGMAGAAAGSGGMAGSTANTCPPTLVNQGSGPGIICQEQTGDTCADDEQFCECGDLTIEGRPWTCVPTAIGCPGEMPEPGTTCSATAGDCGYVAGNVRSVCSCADGSWTCAASDCGFQRPLNGATCSTTGATCDYFIPASPAQPDSAHNLTCTCGADMLWACDDGCPEEFPGDGAACDPNGPINCSWPNGDGVTYCGCNGTWSCL